MVVLCVLFSRSKVQHRRWTDKKRCWVSSNAVFIAVALFSSVADVLVDEVSRLRILLGVVVSNFLCIERMLGRVLPVFGGEEGEDGGGGVGVDSFA